MISPDKLLIALAIGLSNLVTFEPVAGSGGLRTVAISGDAAPGVEAGVKFTTFANIDAAPEVNNSGQVAFTRHLSGTGSFTNDSGIWSEGGGNGLRLVAREGSPAPGTNVTFSDFYGTQIVMNSLGQTAFDHQFSLGLPVTSLNDNGIWSEGGGSGLALVAREGSPAPDTAANYDDLFHSEPRLNDSGQIAFRGFITGSGFPGGIWSQGSGSGLALIALEGHAAPGTTPGVTFNGFHIPVFNNNGRTAFRGVVTGTGVNLSNDDGIWSEGGGNGLALVAREGNPAPGVGPDLRFAGFGPNGPLALNGQGRTAFIGFLTGTGVDPTNQGGLWREEGGSGLALVARAGDHAPGTAPGVSFSFNTFTESLALNDNGQIAFWATLQGAGTGTGVWSDGHGSGLALVAQSGSAAPGTGAGVNFNAFDDRTIELNKNGQTAFWAILSGPAINSTNDNGIWAVDAAGNLRLIVREGGVLDVSDDLLTPNLRTVSAISRLAGNTGNGDGRPSSFSDLGQLAFVARFTDGSEGVFVSNLVAVPEPSSTLILVSLALTRLPARRRAWNVAAGESANACKRLHKRPNVTRN